MAKKKKRRSPFFNVRGDCAFGGWGTFQGCRGLMEGSKMRDESGRYEMRTYISQCTQRTGHLIYVAPHGPSSYVVVTVVAISRQWHSK